MLIANYQTLDQISKTACSILYRARRLEDGKQVLLKQLDPAHADAVHSLHFKREYQLLQSLDVAGLVKPIALIDGHEGLTAIHEDFPGESLDAILVDGPSLGLFVCLSIASHLAHALEGIHAARIIHQDIRPANILLDRESGEVRLMNLGIALAPEHDTSSRENHAASTGDWAYVSPEQTGRMNCPVDYRTDFYSLGITLYQMLTGRLPFQGNDPLEWMHCHIARTPLPPRELAPAIPEAVSDIVLKLLAKLPEDRYQSAHGLLADLEHCLAQWQAAGHIEPFPLGAEDVSSRFHIPHRLYGRERETKALQAAFDRMTATGEAALVTVSGYAGIGKSALVHELHKPIVRERGYFISGKFDQLMRDIPYATLTQAFRDLVQQLLAESEARIADWRQQIQAAVGVNGQLIVDVLPQVELIIGKQSPVPALPPAEAQSRFRMVLQRFMAVFCHKEHPLALFLDDVQWADAASLQFIEDLLTHPDTRYLLLIAAYRDNEVSAAHPWMATLEAIRHNGTAVIDIRLAPLSITHLNRLVNDTLQASLPSCTPLTSLVYERTEGNPFFFTQFLDALHKEGVLRHDSTERVWRWDLDQIKSRDFADNVADLMADKLRRLPEATQEVLQLAACLGNKFELRHLALVSGLADEEIGQRLSAAMHEDLILRSDGHAKFLHDRIQQAAYALIPEAHRAEVHLRIGRTLVARLEAEEIDRHLFDVANQFNRGVALLADPNEKVQVAGINLRAGRKAKASAAYASACVYLAAGMALFDEEDWGSRYELLFNLWLERTECEFLRGDFDTAERLIAMLLRKAMSKVDQAAVYRMKVGLHVRQGENLQAVESGLACLHRLGIDMSMHPTWEQAQAEYEQVWQTLGERSIEDIVDLPLMADPEIRAAMEIMLAISVPTHQIDTRLYFLRTCRMVNLSLRYGAASASGYACVSFGMIIGQSFHRYAEGYRFGKLGCDLFEKHGFAAYKAKTYHAMGLNVLWTRPIATMVDYMRIALREGVETIDIPTCCQSWLHIIGAMLMQGTPLEAALRESEKGLDFVRKAKYQDNVDIILCQQRFIVNMQGQTAHFSTFSDAAPGQDAFDETTFEAQLSVDRSASAIYQYWLLKMQARFLSGDHAAAFAAAQKVQAMLPALTGQVLLLLNYHYYTALILAALYGSASPEEQSAWRERLTAHCEQLREWADIYPPTFRDKHALVAAEIARLEGRDADAMRLYEDAIELARENGFVQCEGIACEAAAGFYLARRFATSARAHLAEARSCFACWGADGKVRQLDARYPQLRAQPSSTVAAGAAQLDALAIAKASQAISGRIVLDELIDTLMRIVLENAGAQSGALLLARGENMVLAADADAVQQAVQVRLLLGQAGPEEALPWAILNYVRRSQTQVLLADAAEPHPFSTDPYLIRRRPKSVLCIPILRQTTLIGLLYLEHTLITHAFTPERVTVLELLASQAAISLENALLYTDLQQENSERKRVEAVLREREARIRRLVESNIIGIQFWDIHGGISDANDAFLRMVGYSREDLQSGALQWTKLVPPTLTPADLRAREELRLTGAVSSSYEREYIRKDGTRIPVLIGAAFLEGSQENGVAFVLDLSERKQAEAEREARQAAEAANRAKSEFLANMSHELRTPLNAILGYAQILLARTPDEKQIGALNVIRQSGDHLLTLINDILDLAKIEAGKLELHRITIPFAAFLHEIVEMVSIRAEQKGLDFICDISSDLPQGIEADEQRLRQVLLNLLSNAVKFTDHGQVVLRVRHFPPSRLRFEVQDTGIGINQEQLETIFQPFEQVGEMRRRRGGTGLGLAISRQFVHLMGGEIRVDSRIGQGSTFWFELDVPATQANIALPPAKLAVAGYAGPRRKVLVVDDVAENRAVMIDMLSPLGFEMVEAVNGRDGLEKARLERPDLILTDLVMPVMDGWETMRQLRRLSDLKEVPIIAISASVSGGDQASSLTAGANAFLPKPVDLEQLLTQIGALLKLKWIERGAAEQPLSELQAIGELVVPPAKEMEDLHHWARMGNMQEILRWAGYVAKLDERYRPFASQLAHLARNYRSKAILNLVEQHMEKS